MPTDGRITSLGTVASLSSTDLVMVVSPGNASSGINYRATIQQIANFVDIAGTPGGSNTQVQFNSSGVFGGDDALSWVGPNLRVGTVGTVGGLQVVGQTAGGVIFNAVASSAVWTFTLPPSAGTANLPLVTDGLGTTAWTTLKPPGGGTGLTAYSTGDLLYASNATTLARLAAATANYLLASVNATSAPNWLGTVPATVGGTGLTSYTTGDLLYASNATTLATLAAATANYILTSNATNLAPSWSSSILVLGSLTTNKSVIVTFKGSTDSYDTILGGGSGGDSYIRGNVSTSRIIIGDQNTGDVLLSSTSGRVVVQATASAISNSTAALVVAGGLAVASTFYMGGPLVASQAGTTTLPASIATTDYRFIREGTSRITMDGFGGGPRVAFRRGNGTSGGMTAVTVTQGFGGFDCVGYDGSNFTSVAASFVVTALESFNATSHGSCFSFGCVAVGTTALSSNNGLVVFSGGIGLGLTAATASDPGFGLLYTNSSSFMIRTKTSYTSGAGASTGTLTNAPAAGNPTKWIPVDDNGTTRYIPAW